MISRRCFSASVIAAAAGVAGAAGPLFPRPAKATESLSGADLRGAIDARSRGVTPDGGERSQRALSRLIAEAARQNLPVYLPPGDYPVSNLALVEGTRIVGVAGATRLLHAGNGFMLQGQGLRRIEIRDVVIDGGRRMPTGDASALLEFQNVESLTLDSCDVVNAASTGISLENCGGRIERNRISAVSDYGIYAVGSTGLSVADNRIEDCSNGGILIHRRAKGTDGTAVTGNRISRIGAANGGTGQYGNGINLYRADDVVVRGNQVSDAAFSAIRANSASNAQVCDNHCTQSGETAIYAEFSFEGAVLSGNLVDGAANGISVVNFNEGGRLAVVANNLVRNLRMTAPYVLEGAIFGVGISVEAETAVTGNVVENAPFWGLSLGFGPYLRNVVVSGNMVRQAGTGCAVTVVEGAGGAMIANNVFDATRNGAIIGYRWHDRATGDLAKGGEATRYPHLTIANNRSA